MAVVLSNPKVSNLEIAIRINNNVFWFDISVNDLVFVNVFKSLDNACSKKLALIFVKLKPCIEIKSHIASALVVKSQIKVLTILECVLGIYYKWVSQLSYDREFI